MLLTDGIHLVSTEDLDELEEFREKVGWPKSRFHKIKTRAHLDVRSNLAEAIENGAHKVSSRALVGLAYWHKDGNTFWLKANEDEGFDREKVRLVDIKAGRKMIVVEVEGEEDSAFEVDINQVE